MSSRKERSLAAAVSDPRCPFAEVLQNVDPNSTSVPHPAENEPSENEAGAAKRAIDTRSFIERKVSNVFDGGDPFALLKIMMPWEVVLALGMLAAAALSAFLPPYAIIAVSALAVLPVTFRTLLMSLNVIPNPIAADVRMGPFTDNIEGEFCVFMLGARSNAVWKLNRSFGFLGGKFVQMLKELERLPGTSGYLGGGNYVGGNLQRGSHVLSVTYWRSYDHLLKYTHDRTLTHTSAMRALAGKLKSMPEIGIWHETYTVKPGCHESVYHNCPPLGLGAASGLVPAVGPLASSRGRMRTSAAPTSATGVPKAAAG